MLKSGRAIVLSFPVQASTDLKGGFPPPEVPAGCLPDGYPWSVCGMPAHIEAYAADCKRARRPVPQRVSQSPGASNMARSASRPLMANSP